MACELSLDLIDNKFLFWMKMANHHLLLVACHALISFSAFLGTSATIFPHAIEVELRGPIHAWEQATTEVLLNNLYWIDDLHPEYSSFLDVFSVPACCFNLSCIPMEMDLHIV